MLLTSVPTSNVCVVRYRSQCCATVVWILHLKGLEDALSVPWTTMEFDVLLGLEYPRIHCWNVQTLVQDMPVSSLFMTEGSFSAIWTLFAVMELPSPALSRIDTQLGERSAWLHPQKPKAYDKLGQNLNRKYDILFSFSISNNSRELHISLQCFDAVGWATGRASDL